MTKLNERYTDAAVSVQHLEHKIRTTLEGAVGRRPEIDRMPASVWLALNVPDTDTALPAGASADSIKQRMGEAIFTRYNDIVLENAKEIRAQISSIFAPHAGAAITHAVGDFGRGLIQGAKPDDRGDIIAAMFNAGHSSSALSGMMRGDIQAAFHILDEGIRQFAEGQGRAPSVAEVEALAAHVEQTGATRAKLTAVGTPLERMRLIADFAIRMADEQMRPRRDVVQAHAEVLHAAAKLLREQVSGLVHKVADGQDVDPGYRWSTLGLRLKIGGATLHSATDFGKEFDRLILDASKGILRDNHIRTIGLAPDQQRLMEHMSQDFVHALDQGGAQARAALGWLGLLNAFIPGPHQGLARSGLGVARAVAGIAVQAAISFDGVETAANAAGERRFQDAMLPAANGSTLDKSLAIESSREVRKILRVDGSLDRVMAGIDEARMEGILAPMVAAGVERLGFVRRLFPDADNAAAFLAQHAAYFDVLLNIKGTLQRQLAVLRQAPGDAAVKSGATEHALTALSGIGPNFGVGQVAPAEKFSALVSFMAKSADHAVAVGADAAAMLRRQADAVAHAIEPEQGRAAVLATLSSIDGVAALADGMQLLSEGLVARQIGWESAPFRQLTDELSRAVYTDYVSDRSAAANRVGAVAGTAGALIGGALVTLPVTFAVAGAGGGVAGILAGAITQAVIAPVIDKAVRLATHHLVKSMAEDAAAVGYVSRLANPAGTLQSVEQIADTIRWSRPSLVALSRNGLNAVVKKRVQDEFVKNAESRFQIGRLSIGALLRAGTDAASHRDLRDVLDFEKANADVSRAAQGLADLAADHARIATYDARIDTARAYVGAPAQAGADPLGGIYEVKQHRLAWDKHQLDLAQGQLALDHAGPVLVARLSETLQHVMEAATSHALPPLLLSHADWTNLMAFFLYPHGAPAIATQLAELEGRLRAAGTLAVGPETSGNFLAHLCAQNNGDREPASLRKAIAAENREIHKREGRIAALVDDHRKYLAGDTGQVADKSRIYQHWLQDYGSAQVERRRTLTPSGLAAMQVGAKLVAGAIQLPFSVLGGFGGAAITSHVSVPELGKVGMGGAQAGLLLSSINPGLFVPSSVAANLATSVVGAHPGLMRTSATFGAHGLDLHTITAVLGGDVITTLKRDGAHVKGVPPHPRAGGAPINFTGDLAAAAEKIERASRPLRDIKAGIAAMAPVPMARSVWLALQSAAPREGAALHAVIRAEHRREEQLSAGLRAALDAGAEDDVPTRL
ncbi:hypothetical protein [Duganella violaceipulchra]|uniref:Uncharacterized protein n=1 Tax=Duganella violaceipulchra TaxID=2849652 RepID=A0AA41L2J0_9BURK|nr:hypothetical protein [Duganella violaceicalia]MBV6322483.1 hypothetical protein [Duganella violaceicalia]MCP2010690.1 hypothetical protein [Duganella violaceicalia]